MLKHCEDYPGHPNCCDSCHEDWDEFDYEMCYAQDKNGKDVAHVCCAVADYAQEQEDKA